MVQAKSSKSKSVDDKALLQKDTAAPNVIVDFHFQQGLFFIAVKNISERPAYKVSVKFNRKLFGLGGSKEVSALPLFRNIEFLAPQKEITTLLDSSDSYFARKQPTKVKAEITFSDAEGHKQSVTIVHDLEIYRELAFVGPPGNTVGTDEVTDEGE